jgi:xanthine dehydrogenase molybdenum-binding subunit
VEERTVFGKPLPRLDALAKATGEQKYLHDIKLPGMLWGKILRSPHAHARIIRIDVAEAEKLPGVRAVITAEDTPMIKFSFVKSLADELPLCSDKVRFEGDQVAAVAADNLQTAEKAIRLIKVEYEILPLVDDPEEAMQPGSLLVHEEKPGNIAFELHKEFGDVEQGFAESDYIFEDRYVTSKVVHCCMENLGYIANWDKTGNLTVWAPLQAPHTVRQEMARILGIEEKKVRVMRTMAGGAFGARLVTDMKGPIAAILSRKTGRPVKIVNSREEEFLTAKSRYPYIIYLKTGVTKEGRILARQARIIVDNGAYNDKGPGTLNFAGVMFSVLYNVPHIKYEGYGVYTNKQHGTAFRGFGNPQVTYAGETQLDDIAIKLGIDPLQIRILNANRPDERTKSGAHVTSCGLVECLEEAGKAAGWEQKMKSYPQQVGEGKYRGIGTAVMVHTGSGSRFYGYAATDSFIKISDDGTVTLITPAVEIGQGALTSMAQIVAEAMGVRLDQVVVVTDDTTATPYDLGAWGSRTSFVCGNAALSAAQDARREVIEVAAKMLDAAPRKIEAANGLLWVKGDPGRSKKFTEVAHHANYKLGYALSGRGRYEDPVAPEISLDKGYGDHIIAYSFACQTAEVEVDTRTGQVKVLKVVAAHDTGRTINPLMAEGQIEGSVVQGLGYALTEQVLYKDGKVLNPGFRDYKTWSSLDVPPMEIILVESDDPNGPFGAKGIGEPGLVPTAAAVSNAIFNATGKRVNNVPINMEKLFHIFQEEK